MAHTNFLPLSLYHDPWRLHETAPRQLCEYPSQNFLARKDTEFPLEPFSIPTLKED
jgi:hypothetical protein